MEFNLILNKLLLKNLDLLLRLELYLENPFLINSFLSENFNMAGSTSIFFILSKSASKIYKGFSFVIL